jgi:hypothetical protein
MVKNLKGGKGAKSMARKSVSGGPVGFPIPTCEFEQLAVVTKMYGPTCDVLFLDGSQLLCHIRKKFKGRRKSGNMIIVGSILLVGLRDWEPETARKNCDLLFVYDNLQTASLADRFPIPALPSSIAATHSDIIFDNTTVDDHEQLPSDISSNNFTTTDHDFFDDL